MNPVVLIEVAYNNGSGGTSYNTGTGCYISHNLVLTANHIFPFSGMVTIRIRLHDKGQWIEGQNTIIWQNNVLDAALIQTQYHVGDTKIKWQEEIFSENQVWQSTAYPQASKEIIDGEVFYRSAGLSGELYSEGGGGQTDIKRLELGVKDPPKDPNDWKGISGAPVMVNDIFAGFIRFVPGSFHSRLEGIPSYELLKDAGFVAAINKNPYDIPTEQDWTLLLVAEHLDKNITDTTRSAIKDLYGKEHPLIIAHITDVLRTPANLLNFTRLVCKATLMIIDGTDFQPGIMMLMGIRSVVRRSLTVVVTLSAFEKSGLSLQPFNIQEIKLVSFHAAPYSTSYNMAAKDRLKKAIEKGKEQAGANPGYLDLPAYYAVRNPVINEIAEIANKVLYLCSFKAGYHEQFLFVRNHLANRVSNTDDIIRMIDVYSPQLVGQSLYEHIRWTKNCIIDWSEWPANVFYELGVRLSSSPISPANIINTADRKNDGPLTQKDMLLRLFDPFDYDMGNDQFVSDNMESYFDYTEGNESPEANKINFGRLGHENIFQIAETHFDWTQENITNFPHVNIRNQVEREFGKDRQGAGKYNVLFSSNESFKKEIQNQIREYWLCAWFYLYNRYPEAEFEANESRRMELLSIGASVLEALDKDEFIELKKKIYDITKRLDLKTLIGSRAIQDLKKDAKTDRNFGNFEAAEENISKAISQLEAPFASGEDLPEKATALLSSEIADCYGILGGIYKRWGMSGANPGLTEKLKRSYEVYDKGYQYEQKSGKAVSYNMLNRLVSRILYAPGWLNPGNSDTDIPLQKELNHSLETIEAQINNKRDDIWAFADLGLNRILLNEQDPDKCFSAFFDNHPSGSDIKSLLDTLQMLQQLDITPRIAIEKAIARLESYAASLS